MSAHPEADSTAPLDLKRWSSAPKWLIIGGAIGLVIGLIFDFNLKQLGYSWLLAFMFYLSICLGGLFLVLVHHLFDASWSVPVRRVNEHIANLAPVLLVLFLPIAALATTLYPWMSMDPPDHALHAKQPLFTVPMFYVVAAFCFFVWIVLSWRLRYWSLQQDETGGVLPTYRMRRLAAMGIFLFAITLTLGAVMWMKSLQHQWFSTMYGVWYFAASVWTTLATVYLITLLLKGQGPLREVVGETQFYFLGSLLFAFTVFYAYITFSQYFIIWNANIPEETFWYVLREKGSWWQIGMIIIFGHFFLPFLTLLRIDVKLSWIMIPIVVWAWIMHFIDLSFNIMPVMHPDGFVLHWMDISCMALLGGVVATFFIRSFLAHPPYPQKDPRLAEALGVHVPPVSGGRTTTQGAK